MSKVIADYNKYSRVIETNYIYFYHLDTVVYLPMFPDTVSDSMAASFQSTNLLMRTAPIFSYSNSGPRTVRIQLPIHRESLYEVNINNSKLNVSSEDSIDITDLMISYLQSAVVPSLNSASKLVNPPMVALRIGDDIYIKGIVNGAISVDRSGPIIPVRAIKDNQGNLEGYEGSVYAMVSVNFEVTEFDPYDADSIAKSGSFRGIDSSLGLNTISFRHTGNGAMVR